MENRREKLIKNVLDLSINCGKVNGNADYILYSEENKEKRKEKINEIKKNLEENCIPFETVEMDESNYEEFLQKRRELISSRLKQYYFSL